MKNITALLLILFCAPLMAEDYYQTYLQVNNKSDTQIYVSIEASLCSDHNGNIAPGRYNGWTIGGCRTNGKIWFSDKIYVPFKTPIGDTKYGKTMYLFIAGKDPAGYYVDRTKNGSEFERIRAWIEQ